MNWFVIEHTILDSDKMQSLPPDLFKLQINLWAIACRYGGEIPSFSVCARILQTDVSGLKNSFTKLQDWGKDDEHEGLWEVSENGNWTPHDWLLYQGKYRNEGRSRSGSERQKAYRERKKLEKLAQSNPENEGNALRYVTSRNESDERDNALQTVTNNVTNESTMKNFPSVTSRVTRNRTDRQTDRQTVTNVTLSSPPTPNSNGTHPTVRGDIDPFDLADAYESTARAIHERHPKHRSSTREFIRVALVSKVCNMPDPISALIAIDANHEAACNSEDWTRENRRFVTGVIKWIESPQSLESPTAQEDNSEAPFLPPEYTPPADPEERERRAIASAKMIQKLTNQ